MTEELRTFGILNDERIVCGMKCEEFIEEVRGEAIKWIKWIRKEVPKNYKKNRLTLIDGDIEKVINCEEYEMDCVVNWIKHFFNINEEDLK